MPINIQIYPGTYEILKETKISINPLCAPNIFFPSSHRETSTVQVPVTINYSIGPKGYATSTSATPKFIAAVQTAIAAFKGYFNARENSDNSVNEQIRVARMQHADLCREYARVTSIPPVVSKKPIEFVNDTREITRQSLEARLP